MQKVSVNDCFTIKCPDGFEVMTEEEMEAGFLDKNPNRQGIASAELHMTVVFLWQKISPLVSMALNMRQVIKNTEEEMKRTMPAYESTGIQKRRILGKQTDSFQYRYQALTGEERSGETTAFKLKGYLFTVNAYVVGDMTRQHQAMFEKITNSMQKM